MREKTSLRVACTFLAGVAWVSSADVFAQAWSVRVGGTARIEFNDNYFFAAGNTESGTTLSVTPFVTAVRQTESTEVTALVAVGGNKVWGLSSNVDYVSARVGLDGSWHDERSTWTGNVAFARAPSLQSTSGQAGGPLVLAFTDSFSANGTYTYALSDRWSLGAIGGAYDNTYEAVANSAPFSDNHGFFGTGKADYAFSDTTRLTILAGLHNYLSGLTDGNAITTTIGVVHQVSPQLILSASAGGYWSDLKTTPSDTRTRDNGPLFGGSIVYEPVERTQLAASLNQYLAPSGYGSLTKSSVAAATLTVGFSERLTGRLGAGYTRTVYPATTSSSATDNYYSGEVGLSYQMAERWTLDAGYRHARARYALTSGEPSSNVGFVSIAYNWPGQTPTDWVGRTPNTQGLPGAGPLPLPDSTRGSSSQSESSPERSPFDPYTIP